MEVGPMRIRQRPFDGRRPSCFVRRRSAAFSKPPSISENNEMVETFIRPIEKAPTDTNLCLFGQDGFGLYQIPFACRLEAGAG
jgi:hypothetical protein